MIDYGSPEDIKRSLSEKLIGKELHEIVDIMIDELQRAYARGRRHERDLCRLDMLMVADDLAKKARD